jgi:hypothetical protein
LQIAYSLGDVIQLALFTSGVTRDEFVAAYTREVAKFLDQLEASTGALEQWRELADRWAAAP